MKYLIKKWLGINTLQDRINVLEDLLLCEKAKMNGFAVLKRHLNRPDKPLPKFGGKTIEQD